MYKKLPIKKQDISLQFSIVNCFLGRGMQTFIWKINKRIFHNMESILNPTFYQDNILESMQEKFFMRNKDFEIEIEMIR